MSNAVKFCVPGTGQVTVSLSTIAGRARVEVADNGPGIPPDEQKHIFEKFHQLKGEMDEKPKGSGLGLAICKSIITYLGGRIWVVSKPGAGAKFIFDLALTEKPQNQEQG